MGETLIQLLMVKEREEVLSVLVGHQSTDHKSGSLVSVRLSQWAGRKATGKEDTLGWSAPSSGLRSRRTPEKDCGTLKHYWSCPAPCLYSYLCYKCLLAALVLSVDMKAAQMCRAELWPSGIMPVHGIFFLLLDI